MTPEKFEEKIPEISALLDSSHFMFNKAILCALGLLSPKLQLATTLACLSLFFGGVGASVVAAP